MKNILAKILLTTLISTCMNVLPVYATSDDHQVFQVSPLIEYVNISPEESAFRDKRGGGSMYIVENPSSNIYKISCIEEKYKDVFALNEAWTGFPGSRNPVANVGYVNNAMHGVESGYMDEVAMHSVHEIRNVADGVGAKPNHYEEHFIWNDVDGKLFLAAICKVTNFPTTEFNILGGYKYIRATEVRMREAPNTNCAVLGYFDTNERVYVYGYNGIDYNAQLPNGWAYVKRANGQVGYVAAQFTKP